MTGVDYVSRQHVKIQNSSTSGDTRQPIRRRLEGGWFGHQLIFRCSGVCAGFRIHSHTVQACYLCHAPLIERFFTTNPMKCFGISVPSSGYKTKSVLHQLDRGSHAEILRVLLRCFDTTSKHRELTISYLKEMKMTLVSWTTLKTLSIVKLLDTFPCLP
jgi:hypothetical protein